MNHNNIKRIRERLEPWFTKGEVSHTHLATKWTVAPCCTAKKGENEKPKEMAEREEASGMPANRVHGCIVIDRGDFKAN